MENKRSVAIRFTYLLGLIFMFQLSLAVLADDNETVPEGGSSMQIYIVWVRKPADEFSALHSQDLESWYQTYLPENTIASSNKPSFRRMVHSYRNVATGFAAKLTPKEVKAMEKKDGFVHAHPERLLPLQTTHSPNFLGLQQGFGLWKGTNYGEGVIIGVLDTGISPDHPSFSDEGVPPPPAKWKGKCEFNGTVCNNKLIGARNFQRGKETKGVSPFDEEGHGTHTSSTAAGNFVKGASVFGMANGTASGIAPYAHLAIYKVCTEAGCAESDMLAALDTAVEDGVDVLSLSIGGSSIPFHQDGIAIGAFGAIRKGIFVSCSAGNSGPFYSSTSNEAPWILTVGASTIDRKISSLAQLGDSPKYFYSGESLFDPKNFSTSPLLPLVYPGANLNNQTEFCASGSLVNVEGKVVVCERGGGVGRIAKGEEVKRAGGAAMILLNQITDDYSTLADAHVLPATNVGFQAGLSIKTYINSTTTPIATVYSPRTEIGDALAPMVASFSSRGPSIASPGILKPDIIGPGVNILAAWPVSVDNVTTFNMISGTSMSCPHLSGIAALIKSSHPDWSPAAIKSAIMTTADLLNLKGTPIVDRSTIPADIYSTGSGHVNPSKANDPGLIYDTKPEDYIPYLCGLNYTDNQIEIITQQRVNCSEVGVTAEAQLNYPSFSITIGSYQTQNYTRTVTNVGPANSTYKLEILEPQKWGVSVNMSVTPSVLTFTQVNQTITYNVEFSTQLAGQDGSFSQGYLRWVSDKYSVYSPIAVIFQSWS
ncbi:hypothetical protein ABKV19_012628 [Rosa sericea]